MFFRQRGTEVLSVMDMSNHPIAGFEEGIPEESNTRMDTTLQHKTRQVLGLKLIVVIALFCFALLAAITAYKVTVQQEEQRFKDAFSAIADKLFAASFQKANNNVWAGLSLSITFTSFAIATNSTFPFVSLPDFNLRIEGAPSRAKTSSISFSPLVTQDNRKKWEHYATQHQHLLGFNISLRERPIELGIYQYSSTKPMQAQNDTTNGPFIPYWQISPPPTNPEEASFVMLNQLSEPTRAQALISMLEYKSMAFSDTITTSDAQGKLLPVNIFYTPVWDNRDDKNVVGVIGITTTFSDLFDNTLQGEDNVMIVPTFSCSNNPTLSIEVSGPNATFLDSKDLHDSRFDNMVKTSTFANFLSQEILLEYQTYFGIGPVKSGVGSPKCAIVVNMYPTSRYRDSFRTTWPIIFPVVCAVLFLLNMILFLIYDTLVERRQKLVEKNAQNSSAIVNSLFPADFRDRLMRSQIQQQQMATAPKAIDLNPHGLLHKMRKNYPGSSQTDCTDDDDAPIAELYANTTIMFADIAGFTAWSSEREPAQVFQLLESIYHTFDVVAKRLGVFKVETIGDCYVCVAGLPVQNKDHAVVMARFAYECLLQMAQLTKELEVVLGPGTSDLALRIGLHSGSVIAGVLRGEKSRFQLFGDTMNVASRMESLGVKNMIQVSQETADLITSAGKQHWLTARNDLVKAKGKGELQTYWITPRRRSSIPQSTEDEGVKTVTNVKAVGITEWARQLQGPQAHSMNTWVSTNTDGIIRAGKSQTKDQRLVDWNTENLLNLLSKLVSSRESNSVRVLPHSRSYRSVGQSSSVVAKKVEAVGHINLAVREQLRDYVRRIAALYRDNPFHNFEHASHVALSANKLLKRIIAPLEKVGIYKNCGKRLSQSTYGISSDPLLQFVIVFSALVHDVDHAGVPNERLVQENDPIAVRYRNKSVAERHSVALALKVLKEPQFSKLQACIYPTREHYRRFRKLLINAVMATDISDKELKLNRQMRWTEAFSYDADQMEELLVDDPKATIVVEHIIQASDVAHTMQHWHIFCKWNARLYNEMYDTYMEGRADTDPGLNWYESELGFFDFYIIPLAKKLKECGVFGISSDEYLNYALENRREWQRKGKAVTADMIARRQGQQSTIRLQVDQAITIAEDCDNLHDTDPCSDRHHSDGANAA